jgi:hypothetical protein
MGVRSGSADSRRAALAITCVAIAAAACTATSPPPLPPRRVAFPEPAPPSSQPARGETVVTWPADLPDAAQPPSRDERYFGWTLAADAVSLVPLIAWAGHHEKVYYAAPALLLSPIIHSLHGEYRSAAISFAMRTAMLGLVYLAGLTADRECQSSRGSEDFICIPFGTLVLLDLAIVTPVVIDSAWLARTARPASEWYRLPLPGATAGANGGRLFTLTARF